MPDAPVAAPPTPAPAAPPAPADDPFSKLDSMFEKPATPPPAPAPPTPKPGEPAKPTPPPQSKPPEAPKPGQPSQGKLLRDELERVKADNASKITRLGELEAKIKDWEAKGKDTEALVKRATDLENQIKERDATIRGLRHEMSPEFIEKYEKPYQRAANTAKSLIEQLQVGRVQLDVNQQREFIPERKATFEDFAGIYRLPYTEAKTRAKEMFGEEYDLVMQQYNKLHDLNREKAEALEEERANAGKREEEERATRATNDERFLSACDQVRKDLENKHPDFYTAPAGDKEAEDILAEGWRVVESKPQTFQQAVILRTRIKLQAASAPMLQLMNRRLKAEVSELKEKLDGKRRAGPGGTKTPSGGGGPAPKPEDETKEEWMQAGREFMAGTS